MLKFTDYDIVFQEIPGEVTLAVNLSNCPNRCKGCHSPYLMEDVGSILDEEALDALVAKYGSSVTCLCFMGGDAEPYEVARLAKYLHASTKLKVAWYSGKPALLPNFPIENFQFIKIGPYIPEKGSLKEPTTNQRLYRITESGEQQDITYLFWKGNVAL